LIDSDFILGVSFETCPTGVPLLGVRVHHGGDFDLVVRRLSVHGLLRHDPREFGDFVRREHGVTLD